MVVPTSRGWPQSSRSPKPVDQQQADPLGRVEAKAVVEAGHVEARQD